MNTQGQPKRLRVLATATMLMVLLSGCVVSREISQIRNDIEDEFPGAQFDRQVVLTVGPRFFRTVGWIARKVNDEDAFRAAEYISEMRRVKVGVFKTERLPSGKIPDFESLERFERNGWQTAAKIHDEDEHVWVLYRERYDAIRDMFVLVLNDDDFVIVRIEGDLDDLFLRVMEDEAFVRDVLEGDIRD